MSHVVITVDIEFKSSDAAPVKGVRVVVETIFSSSSSNAFCRPYISLSHNNMDRFRSECRFRSFGIYGMKRCISQIFLSAYQFYDIPNMTNNKAFTLLEYPPDTSFKLLSARNFDVGVSKLAMVKGRKQSKNKAFSVTKQHFRIP